MSKLTEIQENELFKQYREERKQELRGVQAPQKEAAKKTVFGMARDKLTTEESRFKEKGQKQAGVSGGYVATESETGETFILKHFYKSNQDIPSGSDQKRTAQHGQDRQDAVRELLGSTMYQFLLYDRAPKEGLVKPVGKKLDPNHLYVRSKFFTNATTLSEFTGLSAASTYVNPTKELRALEGLEKANAACDFLGEIDYHPGNLMVQDGKTVTKIDHGRSFTANFTDFGGMVKARHDLFSNTGYTDAINCDRLSFSIEKYSQALNQMLEQYDERQMEAVIDQKFDELKNAGFDPSGTVVFPIDQQDGKLLNSFDELKQFYKDQMRESQYYARCCSVC